MRLDWSAWLSITLSLIAIVATCAQFVFSQYFTHFWNSVLEGDDTRIEVTKIEYSSPKPHENFVNIPRRLLSLSSENPFFSIFNSESTHSEIERSINSFRAHDYAAARREIKQRIYAVKSGLELNVFQNATTIRLVEEEYEKRKAEGEVNFPRIAKALPVDSLNPSIEEGRDFSNGEKWEQMLTVLKDGIQEGEIIANHLAELLRVSVAKSLDRRAIVVHGVVRNNGSRSGQLRLHGALSIHRNQQVIRIPMEPLYENAYLNVRAGEQELFSYRSLEGHASSQIFDDLLDDFKSNNEARYVMTFRKSTGELVHSKPMNVFTSQMQDEVSELISLVSDVKWLFRRPSE